MRSQASIPSNTVTNRQFWAGERGAGGRRKSTIPPGGAVAVDLATARKAAREKTIFSHFAASEGSDPVASTTVISSSLPGCETTRMVREPESS